jgi:tetratricopeptide (TPR) repeat protein
VAHEKVGAILAAQNKLDEALVCFGGSLAIAQTLASTDPDNAAWQRDVSISQARIADILAAQNKLNDALIMYRHGQTIAKSLHDRDPNNAEWTRDLLVCSERLGDVLKSQGLIYDALAAYRESLGLAKTLVEKDPAHLRWRNDFRFIVDRIGGVAYRFLFIGQFATALQITEEAISLAPDNIPICANLAHALMLLGRIDEARKIYVRYDIKEEIQGTKSWRDILLQDFGELRLAGLTRPLMDEIEKEFARN